jgi:hypothetical protein
MNVVQQVNGCHAHKNSVTAELCSTGIPEIACCWSETPPWQAATQHTSVPAVQPYRNTCKHPVQLAEPLATCEVLVTDPIPGCLGIHQLGSCQHLAVIQVHLCQQMSSTHHTLSRDTARRLMLLQAHV